MLTFEWNSPREFTWCHFLFCHLKDTSLLAINLVFNTPSDTNRSMIFMEWHCNQGFQGCINETVTSGREEQLEITHLHYTPLQSSHVYYYSFIFTLLHSSIIDMQKKKNNRTELTSLQRGSTTHNSSVCKSANILPTRVSLELKLCLSLKSDR